MKIGKFIEFDGTGPLIAICILAFLYLFTLVPGCNALDKKRYEDGEKRDQEMNAKGFVKVVPGQYIKVEASKVIEAEK